MHKSLWQDTINLPDFKKLNRNIKTDVLIIGGGICGLLCAYLLKQSGVSCVVLEKDKIAQGTTGNTTAKITSQHGQIYSYLIDEFSKETAEKYLFINENAITKYKEICKNIDCDYKECRNIVYTKDNPQKIENEIASLELLGANFKTFSSLPLPFSIKGAIGFENQAQFNPLKFINHISKDLDIYENTMVKEIDNNTAICDNLKVSAKKIIVATHFPFLNKHGNFFLKLYQHRSYVLALENAQNVNGMYVDEKEGGLSFKNYENLLLLGGCGERTGKKCGNWKELTNFKNKYYPDSKIKYKWATQDCMSLDKIPYIGQYSKNTPNLYVATGFNKWGMTSSMVSAMILCDLVQDINNDYSDIFSPSRSIMKPQLLINGIETVSNFIIPTKKRCPHLGCALKWNKQEHSWDCPCHGSRFEEDGKLINNPATDDIIIKKNVK